MNSIVESFEHVMMPLAGKISSNKYLLAMRDAFSMLLPFIIVGSFFGIITCSNFSTMEFICSFLKKT